MTEKEYPIPDGESGENEQSAQASAGQTPEAQGTSGQTPAEQPASSGKTLNEILFGVKPEPKPEEKKSDPAASLYDEEDEDEEESAPTLNEIFFGKGKKKKKRERLENVPDNYVPDFLEMTIQSCVKPLEMRFSQINGCYKKAPVAYRSYTYINSVVEGVIPPERYSFAADETERGVRLSGWTIAGAIEAIKKFDGAGRNVEFVSARVTPRLVREVDFYGYIKAILEKNDFSEPEKLCLEFPRTVLYEDEEKVRAALLAMKLLKVKTMLAGFGEKDCPITPLFDLPFDFVIISPWLIPLSVERKRKAAFGELVSLLSALGIGIVFDGVKTDEQLTALARTDGFGYIPSPAYEGEVTHGRLRMPVDEALLQSEEEEV